MRCALYVNGELHRVGDEKKHELADAPCCGDEITLHDGRVATIEKRRHNLAGRFLELYAAAEEPKRGRKRREPESSQPEKAPEEPASVFGEAT